MQCLKSKTNYACRFCLTFRNIVSYPALWVPSLYSHFNSKMWIWDFCFLRMSWFMVLRLTSTWRLQIHFVVFTVVYSVDVWWFKPGEEWKWRLPLAHIGLSVGSALIYRKSCACFLPPEPWHLHSFSREFFLLICCSFWLCFLPDDLSSLYCILHAHTYL